VGGGVLCVLSSISCNVVVWNTQHKQEEMCASSASADAKRQCSKRNSPRRCDDLLSCFPSVSHGWPFSVATSCQLTCKPLGFSTEFGVTDETKNQPKRQLTIEPLLDHHRLYLPSACTT
jgi:hypothetical protein